MKTEVGYNIHYKKHRNIIKKDENKYNDNYIINNSLNNHIQNFLRKHHKNKTINTNNNKNDENKEKELGNQYFKDLKSLSQENDLKAQKLNKKNLFEVMKELKIVSYKKLKKKFKY